MVREIHITPVLNGFIVSVGCQRVVFNTPEQLADNVRDYFKNPEATEKKFVGSAVNKTLDGPQVAGEACPAPQTDRPILTRELSEAPRSMVERR